MLPIKIELPSDFLQEETRCDYVITQEMKKVWAVELDLLKQVQDICKKHNIKYMACGGTLLGAVRHKGFIPWDDDIDIAMLREDFEKFCSLHQEFRNPYELQFFGKTKGYFTGHAQLRNVNTTGILKSSLKHLENVSYNQGIFIDIFPLDNVPDDIALREKQKAVVFRYKHMASRVYRWTDGYHAESSSFKRKLMHNLWKLVPSRLSCEYYYHKFIEECTKYNSQNTEYVGMLSFMPKNEKLYIKTSNLGKVSETPFEFMTIVTEENYDAVLKVQYGNYMEFVKGGCYHGGVIFDTDKPFEQWYKDNSSVR